MGHVIFGEDTIKWTVLGNFNQKSFHSGGDISDASQESVNKGRKVFQVEGAV